jgi:O-antigen/teichoic acid export membrane protein
VLSLLFGNIYAEAWIPLSILAVGYFVYSIATPSLKMLELLEKTKLYFWITVLAATANIVLDIVLIPTNGIIGASIGSAVALGLLFFAPLVYLSKTAKVSFMSKRIIISGIMAVLLVGILYTVSKALFGVVPQIVAVALFLLYFIVYYLLLLKVLKPEEKELLNSLLAKLKLGIRIR